MQLDEAIDLIVSPYQGDIGSILATLAKDIMNILQKPFRQVLKHLKGQFWLFVLPFFLSPALAQPYDFEAKVGEPFYSMHYEGYGAESKEDACIIWGNAISFSISSYAFLRVINETILYDRFGVPWDETYECEYEVTWHDGTKSIEHVDGHVQCQRSEDRIPINGFCRPEVPMMCPAEVANPILVHSGAKRQWSTDWTSPIDPRFELRRLYNSDAFYEDAAGVGWGDDWSSPWSRSLRRGYTETSTTTRSVVFGDGVMYGFGMNPWSTKSNPREYGHGYRLQPNTPSENMRFVLHHPNGRKDIFDDVDINVSNLAEARWPDGYSMFPSYDVNGRLIALQDNKNQRAEFTWDDTLHPSASVPVITTIRIDTDFDGVNLAEDVIVTFAFTPSLSPRPKLLTTGRVVTEVLSGNILSSESYIYSSDPDHRLRDNLIAVRDGRLDATGAAFDYATWTYQATGSLVRATTSSHFGGAELTAIGDSIDTASGYSVTVTNPLGKDSIYTFDDVAGMDRLVSVEGVSTVNCLPSDTTASYDNKGRIIERIERNGARTLMTRDSEGRILTWTEDADGLNPRVTTYTWTGELRKPLTRTTAELQESFTYDADTLPTSYTQTDVLTGSPDNGKTRTWTYTYSTLPSGLKVLTSMDGPGLTADGVDDVTTYTYNARGQLLTTTDPNGLTQEVLAYGTSGQPTLIRDHQGFEWALEYDLAGRLLKSTFEPGTLNEETTYTYDIIGQMLSSTDPLGRTWNYTYDEARRLTLITAPSGDTIGFDHDAMGNITRTTYSDAAATIAYLEETQYDELGRVLQAIGSNGQTTSFSHDVEDNLATITDATSLTTTNSYDALNRMSQIVDRANGTTSMAHDVDNQMTSYIDPRGIETAFDFNGFGDLIREVSADRGTMTYSYNNRGMVTSMTDGRGVVTNYAYDDGGRLVSKTFPADPSLDQIFTYHSDPAQPHNRGSLASVTDQAGQTRYSNDPTRGAFFEDLRQIGSATYSTTYTSDAAGQTTQMDYPSGSQLLFSYDADGDLTGLQWRAFDPVFNSYTAPVDVVSGLTYKPHGPLTSLTYGDGGVMTASYDSSYRLTGLTDIRSGTTLRDETYNWTNRNNLGGVTDNLNPAQNQAFTYSNREFLASADGAWGDFDWLYDSVGNRTEQMSLVAGTPLVDVYSYWPDTNQLDSVLLSTGVERRFTYDGAGNVIATNRGALAHSYTYDAANRMASFAVNGVVQAQYQYNALGQQVVRHLTAAGQTIHSVHDALGNRIAEYDYDAGTGSSTLIREYIWASGMIVGVVENRTLYFVRTDHIGRPVFATDDTGVKVWEATYLPFGGVHASTGPNSDLRFPGQWFQSETGLHQNWMRDYDPTLGRYLQADPLGLVPGPSLYGYAMQNPNGYVDPDGRNPLLKWLLRFLPKKPARTSDPIPQPLPDFPLPPSPITPVPDLPGGGVDPIPIPMPLTCGPNDDYCQEQYEADQAWCADNASGREYIGCIARAEDNFFRCRDGRPRKPRVPEIYE